MTYEGCKVVIHQQLWLELSFSNIDEQNWNGKAKQKTYLESEMNLFRGLAPLER